MREISLLQKVKHPNIIYLFEAFDSPKQVFLITEFIEGKSLADHVKGYPGHYLPEHEV